MQSVAGRVAVVFALGAGVSLWACAAAQPLGEREPFSVAVVSAAAVEAVPGVEPEQTAEVAATAEPEQAAAPAMSTAPRGIPTVRMREPTVGPSYPPDLIQAVIRRSMPGFKKCAGEAPGSSPRGALTFTIETDGRVREAAFKNGSDIVTPSKSQQCVLDALRAMDFVPPGGRLTVTYPLATDPAP